MSLISKLEKLERIASGRRAAEDLEPSPELLERMNRIIEEVMARPEPTIHEQIEELREQIKRNELEEPEKIGYFECSVLQFADKFLRSELARLEAEVAKL